MENYNNNPSLFTEKANILKALSHPVRLCIVKGLLERGSNNVTTMYSCLNMPQSTISQHISKLKAAKIIDGNRNGLEIEYFICNDEVKKIIEVLF